MAHRRRYVERGGRPTISHDHRIGKLIAYSPLMTHCVGPRRLLRGWLAFVAITIAPALAAAQDSACTFETCAMTVHTQLLGTGIYEGPDRRHVATIGLFPGGVDRLQDASDSTAYYYSSFRRHYNIGSALAVTALVGATVGSVLALTVDDGQVPILAGTALFSIGFSFAGRSQFSVGRQRLERSVMWHNRTLLGSERRIDRIRP